MPIKFNYSKDNDRYAQLYRLQELLRLEFNNQIITREQHNKLEDEVIEELLFYRERIKKDKLIRTATSDIYGL